MSSKDRYIKAAKQFAFHSEVKKQLDADAGAYIKRTSFADYARLLINEGVLKEPPPAKSLADWDAEVKSGGKTPSLNNSPYGKWSQAAFSLITKKFGVTSASNTPGYDAKRNIFIDFGGSYMSRSIGYLMGIPVTSKDGSKTEGGGMLWDSFKRGSGLQEDGSYKSPWAWNITNISQGLTGNSQTQDEADQAYYNKLKARADNIWGDEQNYVPVKAFSWGGQGKELTQAEAQKDPRHAWTKIALDGYDSYKLGLDTKRWQRERNKFGMSNNIGKVESIGLKYDGHSWYKNIFSDSEIPDLSTVEMYRANRDLLTKMYAYARMVQTNNGVFDRNKRTIKDGINLGFTNYTEYSKLSNAELAVADSRIRTYNDYYKAKAHYLDAKSDYESSAKTKSRQKALGSLAIGLATGGLFSLAGLTSSIATATSLSPTVVTGSVVGGASGASQGGLEGAVKGAITGGLGAAAGEFILGKVLPAGSGNTLTDSEALNSLTRAASSDILIPEAFKETLGATASSSTAISSTAGLLTPDAFKDVLGTAVKPIDTSLAGQFNESTKDVFKNAITPPSIESTLKTIQTGSTPTPSVSQPKTVQSPITPDKPVATPLEKAAQSNGANAPTGGNDLIGSLADKVISKGTELVLGTVLGESAASSPLTLGKIKTGVAETGASRASIRRELIGGRGSRRLFAGRGSVTADLFKSRLQRVA